jgi:adenosylmethionine-8-amino-7-oxononanoate aminotransferase
MAQAIADQAERLAFSSTFVDMTNDPAALLSAKLAELAPGDLNHVHFTTGGSTAIDSAFRMAQFAQAAMGFPERKHMIARRHSYHGSTYASMSLGLRNGDRAPEFGYETDLIHHIEAPYLYRRPDGMSEAAFCDQLVAEFEAEIAEIGVERIAAFFAEPIQASGGVLVPPEGYLKAMWEVCQRHGILFVADEVVTAFGRLGHWFASHDAYGVQPDMICCAKGLSSGYQPIGALIFSDRIWRAMAGDPDRWYTSGFTYSGHPVACAAALKNIEIMEREALLPHASKVGAYFQERLADLHDLPLVGDVRGKALIGCVENVADKATKTPLPEEIDIGKLISDECEVMGLLVRPIGALNVMSPSLIITEDQIDFTVDVLGKAIKKVADDLTGQGVKIG